MTAFIYFLAFIKDKDFDEDGAPLGPDNVFDAFLINDVTITAALKKMHTTP